MRDLWAFFSPSLLTYPLSYPPFLFFGGFFFLLLSSSIGSITSHRIASHGMAWHGVWKKDHTIHNLDTEEHKIKLNVKFIHHSLPIVPRPHNCIGTS